MGQQGTAHCPFLETINPIVCYTDELQTCGGDTRSQPNCPSASAWPLHDSHLLRAASICPPPRVAEAIDRACTRPAADSHCLTAVPAAARAAPCVARASPANQWVRPTAPSA